MRRSFSPFYTAGLVLPVLLVGWAAQTTQEKRPSPQQASSLARRAYAILEAHCSKCHGNNATAGFTFRDRKATLAKEQIQPGNPNASRIYIRAVLHTGGPMPPASENNPLNAEEQAILKDWIIAGAPEVSVPVSHRFISQADMLQAIAHDLEAANERERPYLRYFTLTNLYNEGASEEELKAYRDGVSKLINSLSWEPRISVPEPIGPADTILRIDLRKYSWTADTWNRLLGSYPYQAVSNAPTARHIRELADCDPSYIRADWFVARAAVPPLYHDLLSLPGTSRELEAKLNVNVDRNIEEETAVRAGLQESGVSRNNRVVERHDAAYGAYWRSYDFRGNADTQNIFEHPLDFQPAGGEIIFNLPNHLQAYMLVNGNGQRINDGPIDVVNNKESIADPVVHNGLTCMSCHVQGMRRWPATNNTLRSAVMATDKASAEYDRDKVLAIYPEDSKLVALLNEDAARFADAVREATGNGPGDKEPLVVLQSKYEESLDASQAAAEFGLTTDDFTKRLNRNAHLGQVIGVLKTPLGRVKRDAWENEYGAIAADVDPQDYSDKSAQNIPIDLFNGNDLSGWIVNGAPWSVEQSTLRNSRGRDGDNVIAKTTLPPGGFSFEMMVKIMDGKRLRVYLTQGLYVGNEGDARSFNIYGPDLMNVRCIGDTGYVPGRWYDLLVKVDPENHILFYKDWKLTCTGELKAKHRVQVSISPGDGYSDGHIEVGYVRLSQ